jgi:DNA polymerase-3 subunit epsilon
VLVEGGRVLRQEVRLIKPPRPMAWHNTRVHGLTDAMVAGAPRFAEVWLELLPLLEGVECLVAHNAPFDRSVLTNCCAAARLEAPRLRWEDTVTLAKRAWPDLPRHKLDVCCEHLGITLQHHEALSDALACAEVYQRAAGRTLERLAPPAPRRAAPAAQAPAAPALTALPAPRAPRAPRDPAAAAARLLELQQLGGLGGVEPWAPGLLVVPCDRGVFCAICTTCGVHDRRRASTDAELAAVRAELLERHAHPAARAGSRTLLAPGLVGVSYWAGGARAVICRLCAEIEVLEDGPGRRREPRSDHRVCQAALRVPA